MITMAVIIGAGVYVAGNAVVWACLMLASHADEQLADMGLLGGNDCSASC